MFGGDVTMSRKRAEIAVAKLTPFYPMSRRWTAKAPLPGGDFPWPSFDDQVDRAQARWRFLSEHQARRLVAAYGTRIAAVLGDAQSRDDLGPAFGDDLTGIEVRYLMTKEWARFPDDILWRRSASTCRRRIARRWQRSWRWDRETLQLPMIQSWTGSRIDP